MKSKTKQILGAIGLTLILWILEFICSGTIILADTASVNILTESAQIFLSGIYPYFFVCVVIAATVISAKKKKKYFAITTVIMAVVPFAALGIEFLLTRIFPDGTVLLVPFMFLASPAGTLINMLM